MEFLESDFWQSFQAQHKYLNLYVKSEGKYCQGDLTYWWLVAFLKNRVFHLSDMLNKKTVSWWHNKKKQRP